MERRLTLIPFEPTWLSHQSLDLTAVYKRPQRVTHPETQIWDIQRDADGFVLWDICSALPIRQHRAWLAKGMEYVTLSTESDVIRASDPKLADWGAIPLGQRLETYPTEDPAAYIRQPSGVRGPWNAQVWMKDEAAEHAERRARIIATIAERGAEWAQMFERQTDPEYVVPDALIIEAAKQAAAERPAVRGQLDTEKAAPKRKRGRPPKPEPEQEAVTA